MSGFHPNDPGITSRAQGAATVTTPCSGSVPVGPATLHRFPRFDDIRGSVVVSQAPGHLPFVPVRMFQVFDVPAGELRGDHAHRRCHQLIMVLSGAVSVVVDDGRDRYRVVLDAPELGLHLPPMTWAIQSEFEPATRMLVLASEPYDRAEYIDDYAEFTALVRPGGS